MKNLITILPEALGTLVPFLICVCCWTIGLSMQQGPCAILNGIVYVTENVQTGELLRNWPQDNRVESTLVWSKARCDEYFNVTGGGLVTKKVIDLDDGSFDTFNGISCEFTCGDEIVPRVNTYNLQVGITAVNEFSPEFEPRVGYRNLSEMTPAGLTIFTVDLLKITDKDKGDGVSQYALQPSDGVFLINKFTGEISLVNGNLDYDTGIREINRTLIAFDTADSQNNIRNGSMTLIFRLTDVDDQGPAFGDSDYHIDIPEENTTIVDIPLPTSPPLTAYDQDRGIDDTVLFRLKSVIPDLPDTFSVDTDGGYIRVLKTIDREQPPLTGSSVIIRLVIEAYENSTLQRSSSTTVTVNVIDVDDHLPVFKQLLNSTEIPEHPIDGSTVIYVTATDKDEGKNAEFQYELRNDTGYFSVTTTPEGTGLIRVANGSGLDREKFPVVKLTIGTDKGEMSPAIIQVKLLDVNDNTPVFDSSTYTFEIQDSTGSQNGSSVAAVGDILGHVSATDKDEGENARVTYSFGSPGTENYLSINGNSGEITVIKTPLPLEGDVSSMEFFVKATDNGYPRLESITHVKITQFGDDVSSYLYANVAANLLERDKDQLQKNMSSIMGIDLSLVEIRPESTGGVDLSRSRLKLSAKYNNGTQVSRTDLKKLTTEKYQEIQALFDAFTSKPDPIILSGEKAGLSPSEIALIVIGGVVFVASLFLIMVFCRMSKQLKLYKSLTSNMSRRPTIYESQEIKMDITVETSDYDKSESLDSVDIENGEGEPTMANGNLVIESPVGNEVDDEGNPLTVWNPVFAGENDAANISEVTEMKKYYTYPNMINFGEDYSTEDLPDRTDGSENETTVLTNDDPPYQNAQSENDDAAGILPNSNPIYQNTPQDVENLEDTEDNDENVSVQMDDTNVEATHQKSFEDKPTDTTSHPSPAEQSHGPSDEPPMLQPEMIRGIIDPSEESLLKDSFHEPVQDDSPVSLPTPIPDDRLSGDPAELTAVPPEHATPGPSSPHLDNNDPIEDYDMSEDVKSPSVPKKPVEHVPGILIQPNPDYYETDPSTENLDVVPEPKPDYNKVSFADTAVAINEDDVVEIIKQPLTDNNGIDGDSSAEDDSESQTSSEETPSEPVQLISSPINRPPDAWEPSGHLESDFASAVTVDTPLASPKKPVPTPSGFTKPSFVMDENENSPQKSEEDTFFFSEVSTKL